MQAELVMPHLNVDGCISQMNLDDHSVGIENTQLHIKAESVYIFKHYIHEVSALNLLSLEFDFSFLPCFLLPRSSINFLVP